jgi:hypothetical protein
MNDVAVVRLKDRLDALFQKTTELPDSEEIRSHWARYLCVLVSGFIEESLLILLTNYTSRHADERLQDFIVHRLKRVQNAKHGVILDLLAQFDQSWKVSFEANTRGELADAINSVVDVGHKIAHGKSTGISIATISEYWTRVVRAIEILEADIGS